MCFLDIKTVYGTSSYSMGLGMGWGRGSLMKEFSPEGGV